MRFSVSRPGVLLISLVVIAEYERSFTGVPVRASR